MATATQNRIEALRNRIGITQRVMARLIGVTERTLIDLEGGREISENTSRRLTELERLFRALMRLVRREAISTWLTRPNKAFDGDSPADVIAKGKADLLWRMVFELRSGVAS